MLREIFSNVSLMQTQIPPIVEELATPASCGILIRFATTDLTFKVVLYDHMVVHKGQVTKLLAAKATAEA